MKPDKKQIYKTVAAVVLIAAIIRLPLAAFCYNELDLITFNVPWANGMGIYGFSAYTGISNLDYPPMFPFLLWPLSGLISSAQAAGNNVTLMFLIKLLPVIFDLALVALIGFVACRQSLKIGSIAAICWAFNPMAVLNCAVWGQTDSMMLFFIAAMMISFYDKKPMAGTVIFALGCLCKLQMVYLAPILILELFVKYQPAKAISSLLTGAAVGIAGWVPFMLGSHSLTLPFSIYFGGAGSYKFINLNAFNLYGVFGGNWIEDSKPIFGKFTYHTLSLLFVAAIYATVVLGYVLAKRSKASVPAYYHAFFVMNAIFILTTRMHERYQAPAVILIFLCWMFGQDKRFAYAAAATSVVAFLNQGLLLFSNSEPANFFDYLLNRFQATFSIINVILFVVTTIWYIKACRNKPSSAAVCTAE